MCIYMMMDDDTIFVRSLLYTEKKTLTANYLNVECQTMKMSRNNKLWAKTLYFLQKDNDVCAIVRYCLPVFLFSTANYIIVKRIISLRSCIISSLSLWLQYSKNYIFKSKFDMLSLNASDAINLAYKNMLIKNSN